LRILAIETSGPVGSVCVSAGEAVRAERRFTAARQHARCLVPSLDDVFREAGWRPGGPLDFIAVSEGPGSYTGLRVGAACAKALGYAVGCPLVGVNSLDVLAQNLLDVDLDTSVREAATVCVAVDAKRGEAYTAVYERRAGEMARIREPALVPIASLVEDLPRPVWLIGDAARACPAAGSEGVHVGGEAYGIGRAAVVARLGLEAYRRGRREEPAAFAPVYMRRPEAEERRLKAEGRL